jgi:hypothetical protein
LEPARLSAKVVILKLFTELILIGTPVTAKLVVNVRRLTLASTNENEKKHSIRVDRPIECSADSGISECLIEHNLRELVKAMFYDQLCLLVMLFIVHAAMGNANQVNPKA